MCSNQWDNSVKSLDRFYHKIFLRIVHFPLVSHFFLTFLALLLQGHYLKVQKRLAQVKGIKHLDQKVRQWHTVTVDSGQLAIEVKFNTLEILSISSN